MQFPARPPSLPRLMRLARQATIQRPAYTVSGTVSRISPSHISATGISKFVSIGDVVLIECKNGPVLAEVAAIDARSINVMPFTGHAGIELGAEVQAASGPFRLRPDMSWRGRVISPLGMPLDELGPLPQGDIPVSIFANAPRAMGRGRTGEHIETGIKAIDLFTPVCAGQRIGIFAGSGVGKSTLLAMLGRSSSFDTVVLSLVGERGREVRDFIDDDLAEHRARIVAVVATADESPMMRRLAPSAAMSVAEHFRDRGQNVLIILDSVTRFAHAMRELALAFQEPPVARGYPPSVFGALSTLLERAGPGAEGAGTITAFVSVLVDGDDHNEPIADSVRGILDGHIVLDRDIAAQGRFPALNPLRSISRLAPKLRSPGQTQFVAQLLDMISRFEDTRDLRTIGGYQTGGDPALDRAIDIVPRLYDLLKQDPGSPQIPDIFAYLGQALQPPRRSVPA